MSDTNDTKGNGGGGPAIALLALVAFFAIPAVFPKFAVRAAAIIWPCIYVWLWYSAQHFSLLEHLPWTVERNLDPFANWYFLALLVGIATIFGIDRGIAVLVAWIPMMFIGPVLVGLGLSVVHGDGSVGFYRDNYSDNCGNLEVANRDNPGWNSDDTVTCLHTPLPGRVLPSYTTKIYEDRPIEVIPYRGSERAIKYVDLSETAVQRKAVEHNTPAATSSPTNSCTRSEEKIDGGRVITEICTN